MLKMRSCLVLLLIMVPAWPVFAQTAPDFNSGLTPYQTYHGGDIDSINTATGSLNLHIPLISFPQRGSGLRLTFAINYNSTTVQRKYLGWGATGYYQWLETDTNYPSVTVVDDQGYGIYETMACLPAPPCTSPNTQVDYFFYSVTGPDGAQHVMGYTSGTPTQKTGAITLRSMDMTGFYLNVPDVTKWYGGNYTIYDASGNKYNGWNSTAGVYGYSNAWRTDANGNSITLTSGTYTDTMGRSIPAPPPTATSTNNTDTTGCTGPLPITKAVLWQVPGYNGQSYPIKFCYASISISVSDDQAGQNGLPDSLGGSMAGIQSIVLPDAQTLSFSSGTPTAWEFEYNDIDTQNYCFGASGTGPCQFGTLSKVTLPTGGSISYTYQMVGQYNHSGLSVSNQLQRAVRTRTVSDGATSNTWTYTYTAPSYSTVVTAPKLPYDSQANDTKYTVAEMSPNNFDSMFVTQIDYYQGSYSSGTLLKTVAKGLASYTNPYFQVSAHNPGLGASTAGQLLNSETTTLSNSKVSQTAYAYDSGFSVVGLNGSVCCTFFYGVATNATTSDYGTAPNPGPVLRQTANTYKWQTDANTLNSNLLQLKASTIVKDGSGHKCAESDYYYDDPARLFSSGITHGSPSAARGNPSSVVDQLTSTPCTSNATWTPITSYRNVYDTGMLYQSIDPLGHTTTFSYSPTFNGTYVTQTNLPDTGSPVVHHVVSGNYDFNTGLVTQFTDENNQNTSYGYDYLRRMTSATFPTGGGEVTFAYTDAIGALQVLMQRQQTSSTWIQRTEKFDGLGRKIQDQLADPDPNGTDFTDTSYDSVGRVYSVSNPHRATASSTDGTKQSQYDALGRVLSTTEQDGSQVLSSYNANCTTVTDEAAKSRRSCTDGLERLTQVFEDPNTLHYETDYLYDPLGDMTGVTQKGGASSGWRLRSFVYDSLSRLTSATNPESGTLTYGYVNSSGALCAGDKSAVCTKTAPSPNQAPSGNHVTTTYTYDTLNRLTAKSYNDTYSSNPATPTVTYGYDGAALTCPTPIGIEGSGINGIGRRTAMCNNAGSESWGYDPMGRITAENERYANPVPPFSGTVYANGAGYIISTDTTYDYYLNGDLSNILYPGPHGPPDYEFYTDENAAGQVTSAGDIYYTVLNDATYTPTGQLASATVGWTDGTFTGNVISNTYNSRLQPVLVSASTPSGSQILNLTYNFNLGNGDNGNVIQIVNGKDGNRTQNFLYDPLNRIWQAYTNGTNWGETYSPNAYAAGTAFTAAYAGIDAWGNLTNRSGVTGKTGSENALNCASANINNQLNTCFTYDAAGNMIQNGSITYTYDAENRLIATAGTSYVYDGDGQRVEKCTEGTTPGTCTSNATGMFYWHSLDGGTLAESDLGGNWTAVYGLIRGEIGSRVDLPSNVVHYYFQDHLKSTDVVTAANGTILKESDYYPYGGEIVVSGGDSNRYKFTGKERDSESGLDNFGARYNASSMGRFMTPDSLNTLDLSHPQKLNRYAYANNNPLSNVDVGGHCTAPAVSGGQVGICVESYIRARFLPGIINHLALAQGDNRGPNPHGGTFRTQTLLSVDPSTHEVKIQGQAPGKSCAIEGCYLGVNNSYLSKTTHDDKGNTYFTLTVYGENGYEANGKAGAPGGWIEMQFSFTVNSKGEVTVSNPETKGYPSASIYSYDSGGNAQDVWQQTESGNINDLVGPRHPANDDHQSSHVQEDADRLCALGNPAACD
jgi:RHS repeat-associated protein